MAPHPHPASQPLPPAGESYIVLRPDGTFESVGAINAEQARGAVVKLRRRRLAGWIARCWRTPRGQIWLDPAPLVSVGAGDYEAASRALLYLCSGFVC